jgi:nicotinamide riboside transporter PnuC
MEDLIQWFATFTGIAAAIMVASNISAKVSGYGFIIFTGSSVAWVTFGVQAGEPPLAIQNIVLTVINLVGIYRWLIKPAKSGEKPPDEA